MGQRVSVICAFLMVLGVAATACAQSPYVGQTDPCSRQRSASIFAGIVDAMTEQQRQQACLAERKAQWDDYYARQSAAKEQEDAEQARQKQQLELERLRFQEQQEREAEAQRAAEREQQKERRAAYVALVAAEQSPENHCRVPEVARGLIDTWNSFDIAKENDIHIVDIEHLTTTAFDGAAETITCHGVFVTSRSRHLIGTLQIRKNVAGDPLSSWEEDASQDLSIYEAPPAAETDPQPIVARQDVKPAEPTAPTDALSAAFANGLADRQKWEIWLASLGSDEKDGANWWAANRNVRNHAACKDGSSKDNATWLAGCLNAQQMLTPVDLKRRADPQYKKGWNSF